MKTIPHQIVIPLSSITLVYKSIQTQRATIPFFGSDYREMIKNSRNVTEALLGSHMLAYL